MKDDETGMRVEVKETASDNPGVGRRRTARRRVVTKATKGAGRPVAESVRG